MIAVAKPQARGSAAAGTASLRSIYHEAAEIRQGWSLPECHRRATRAQTRQRRLVQSLVQSGATDRGNLQTV
jgi:hypothetical protein